MNMRSKKQPKEIRFTFDRKKVFVFKNWKKKRR